jgi:hypothetical protein
VESTGRKHTGVQANTFRPAWWLPGAHAQTIAGRLLRRPRPLPLRRERIELPDGDFVDLDFAPSAADAAPLVLLLHGLEGSARRGYAYLTYAALARRGLSAVGLNFRSCSGEPNRQPRFYHSGDTEDLRYVLHHLRRTGRPVSGAIGFSLGGNVLLKFLGEEEERGPDVLHAAVAVSVPYDLSAGADALAATVMGRFYTGVFLKSLIPKVEAIANRAKVDHERIRAAVTFRDFDDAATAPLHGFRDAADYYARSSSAAFLEKIRVPALLVHSEDDPFLPGERLPREAITRNPCLQTAFVPRGGHVGFIGGSPWAPVWWAESRAAAFLADTFVADRLDASRADG